MSSSRATTTAPSAPAGSAHAERPPSVLVLDDEPGIQRLMQVILAGEGYRVRLSDDGKEALDWIAREGCDLVVQDLRMPKMDGLTFLRQLKERFPDMLSIVVTAYGTWETAVEAMRLGAYTHLSKPFDTEQFRQVVARALERKRMTTSSTPAQKEFPLLDIVGFSPSINAVIQMVKRVAPTDTTVLISGESGTGKELVARGIHYHSLRVRGPFVPVNCGAFTESLLESELFGHAKGAFTNAIADRKGLFESADMGTLFLDEIGEMSPVMQVKLLRVLETQTFKPVGSNRDTRVDVRIIAATNRNLSQMCQDGSFREDLYHRLNVIPITLPPLRERADDIPLLAGHFLAHFSKRMNKPMVAIDPEALQQLARHHWPGNVRELENAIERAVALCPGDRITPQDIVITSGARRASDTSRLPPGGVTSGGNSSESSGQLNRYDASAPPPMYGRRASDAPFPQGTPMGGSGLSRATPSAGNPAVGPGALASPGAHPGMGPALPSNGLDLELYLLNLERSYIVQALERSDWNMTEAAKLLGMTFRSIRYRVSKLGIEKPPR